MATPEEDKVKLIVELMDKFGTKTRALSDAMDKLKLSTVSTRDGVERANRERIVEADLIKKAQQEYKNLVKEQLEGKKTQREVNEEMIRQRKLIRENNDLTAEQKASMLAALDTARVRGAAEARAADASERYGKAVDTASKIFTPAMQAVTGVLKGISNKDLLGGAGEILQAEAKFVSNTMGGIGQGLVSAAPAIAGFGKWGKILAGAATVAGIGLQAFGGVVNGVSQIIGPMTAIIKEFTENYTKASQAGVVLGGGMGELRELAGRAGMRMSDLVDGVTSSEDAFRRSGLSLSQATKMVGTFGRGLVEGGEATKLFALGFTDVASRVRLSAGAYEQARMAGISQAEAQKNLTELTVQYGKDLKVVQAVVGKEAEEAMRRAQVQQQSAALQGMLNAEQQKAFTGMFASLSKLSPELRSKAELAFIQIAKTGTTNVEGIVGTELESTLYEMAGQMKKGTKNIGDATTEGNKLLLSARDRVIKDPNRALDIAKDFGVEGVAKAMADTQNQLLLLKDSVEQGTEAQEDANKVTENTDATTKSLAQVTQNQQKLSVALEQAATSVGAVNLFAKALQEAQKPLLKLIEMIEKASKGENITGSIMSTIGDVLKDIAIALGTGALAGLIYNKLTGGSAGGGLMNKIFGGGSGAAGGLGGAGAGAGGLGGGPAAGGAGAGGGVGNLIGNVADGLSKLGPMLSSIGKGAGEAIGGIMQGIATGLTAFAKPQILLGATILGASITLIGAGIAGAAWIMGKALPTLAEGLSSFANINGENLISVGKGVAALGAGLAVFGAGGILGSVGNVFSSLVDGFGKLFGGKSQIEKLQEFAKMGPGLAQAGDGLTKFTSGLKDLAAIDPSGIGKVADAVEKLKKANEKGIGSRLMDFVFDGPKDAVASLQEAQKKISSDVVDFVSNESKGVVSKITQAREKVSNGIMDFFFGESKSATPVATPPVVAGASTPKSVAMSAPEQFNIDTRSSYDLQQTSATASQTRATTGANIALPKESQFKEQMNQTASILYEDNVQQRQKEEKNDRARVEEVAFRDQNKVILEQTMTSMQSIESQMKVLLDYSRQIVDHTEATARGVR